MRQVSEKEETQSGRRWHLAGRILDKIADRMNNLRIRKKLYLLYVFCVLVPLIITDSVIIAIVVGADRSSLRHELENIASSVQYNLDTSIESAVNAAKSLYINPYVYEFLDRTYDSDLDYFTQYWNTTNRMLFKKWIGDSLTDMVMYTNNSTVLNGGRVSKISSVETSDWYRYFVSTDDEIVVYPYYLENDYSGMGARRKICVIQKLDYYKSGCSKLVKLELDYSKLLQTMVQNKYEAPVYVCIDGYVFMSNDGSSSSVMRFEPFNRYDEIGYRKSISSYGQQMEIIVLNKHQSGLEIVQKNLPLILFLILLNAALPLFFTQMLYRSFTGRLQELSFAFARRGADSLAQIPDPRGADEIGGLMRNYNEMAETFNGLIQTVYKERLKQQEIDIARQRAELLALHSQINPHFLFNALETIRMHSVIKHETETAYMVERLAMMERQYTDWSTDLVTVREEAGFAEAYLELQKYRFGKRLSYQIAVEESCASLHIPKLTILTFAENACVHGIENKAVQSWVFIRMYQKDGEAVLEVEDTGSGMSARRLAELQELIAHASIDSLRKNGRVGVINACLRLQMMTQYHAKIELESEEGVGTTVTVRIPLEWTEVEQNGYAEGIAGR